MEIIVEFVTFILLVGCHLILFKATQLLLRPHLPQLLNLNINSNKDTQLNRVNVKLKDLDYPPLPMNLIYSNSQKNEVSHLKNVVFDLMVSNSIHLIFVSILNTIMPTGSIKIDQIITVDLLVGCILYITPMVMLWTHLNDEIDHKITYLVLYVIGTFIFNYVIVKGILQESINDLTQMGVYLIDILGVSSIAIINLITCSLGVKDAYQYWTINNIQLYEMKSLELNDIIKSNREFNLIEIDQLCDEVKSIKNPPSIFKRGYWGYCIIRSGMWINTIISFLNLSVQSLKNHKRDQRTSDLLNYFFSWDQSRIDVIVSLISLIMNLMSTWKLVQMGDHIIIMALICGISTLLALT